MTAGIDTMIHERMYHTRSIGLLTNHTGVLSSGTPTWKALLDAGYRLKALFGPEHGFRGEAQDVVPVQDSSYQGIAIHSLFGERLAPTQEMLAGIDLVLVDMQDIGCRYYTYIYTLAHMMAACEQQKIPMLVTDRHNPIDLYGVCGKSMPENYSSFVGGYGLPILHGLTIGEFARYVAATYYPSIELQVVPVNGHRKHMPFRTLGIPWVAPSPNIPTIETATVYPGSCLFEATNVSEGRGTTRPFQIIGAPWIDGEHLRGHLATYRLPGVVFTSQYFTPTFSKYRGQSCQGVCIHVIDATAFLPLETGIALLHAIRNQYPASFEWKPDWNGKNRLFIDALLGSPETVAMLDSGEPYASILQEILPTERTYLEQRELARLYPDS